MRVLFVNHTFPGPFRYLAAGFGALPGNTVLFASEYGRRDLWLPEVRRVIISRPRDRRAAPRSSASTGLDKAEKDMGMAFERGRSTARSLLRVRAEGFVPDLVFASASMGHGLYLRTIFPEAFFVGYGDWYYQGGDAGAPSGPDIPSAPQVVRNLLQEQLLVDCEVNFTATQWQRRQYPPLLTEHMLVLSQCVDTDFFSPAFTALPRIPGCDLSGARELLAVSGRSVASSQDFGLLLDSLPIFLRLRPYCHVVLMAGKEHDMVRRRLEALGVHHSAGVARVHVPDFLPPEDYLSLLRAARLYVYLNVPFMLSSGLLEAMSCGCVVLGMDTEAVREIVRDGQNGFLYAPADAQSLARRMAELMEAAPDIAMVGEAARRTVCTRYSVVNTLKIQLNFFLRQQKVWNALRRVSSPLR